MTTTWQIKNMRRQADTGLVIGVRYECIAELNGATKNTVGRVRLSGDVNDPNFIAFENLTQETVVGWVKDQLGVDKVAAVEAATEAKHNPAPVVESTQTGLPW